jgi:hypothetical protein
VTNPTAKGSGEMSLWTTPDPVPVALALDTAASNSVSDGDFTSSPRSFPPW